MEPIALQSVSAMKSADDLLRKAVAYSEFGSELSDGYFAWYVRCAHFSDLVIGKFCTVMGFAMARIFRAGEVMALLGNHILNVVILGAKKKMQRVAALRIIATVQNPKAPWVFVVGNFPNDSMRQEALAARAASRDSEFAISRFGKQAAHPIPAFVPFTLFDPGPEGLKGFLGKIRNQFLVSSIAHIM